MNREVTFADITRAVDGHDPQLADLVVRYLDLPDPPEDRPEDSEEADARALAQDAWTLGRLRGALQPYALWGKSAEEIKTIRVDAWEQLMDAANPPPRLRLGELLVRVYERGTESDRAALIDVFTRGKTGWGMWKAFKVIYKLAEQRHDAELFGVLAWRLDVFGRKPNNFGEVSPATSMYLRRRAWRYLRNLGQAVPELYPQFAVQVLRHYERDFVPYGCWIIQQIWNHKALIGKRSGGWQTTPPDKLSMRAYDEAWKLSPEPLLRLIEDSENDGVLAFATRSLEQDFPNTLREVDPAWLGRLGRKPSGSVHEFVIKLLEKSPEFHQSKLAGLGLHDMVLELLASPSDKAVKYAIEYANAHAKDIPTARLVELLIGAPQEPTRKFAQARLEKVDAKQIGLSALIRLLDTQANAFAAKQLEAAFTPKDITADIYIALMTGGWQGRRWVEAFYAKHKQKPAVELLKAMVESRQVGYWDKNSALESLGERKAKEIGIDWIKAKLLEPELTSEISGWFEYNEEMFAKGDIDAEWLKGLVMNQRLRSIALAQLRNTKLIGPRDIGLPWLLAMARQADVELSGFARQYLLEHFSPIEFAGPEGKDAQQAGLDRLWAMAAGKAEPEAIRLFAQTYLLFHHPGIGVPPEDPLHGIVKPRLKPEDYTIERARELFEDPRPDVRRFVARVGQQELVRWGERDLAYALAASEHKESRKLGCEVLLEIGEDHEGKPRAPADWLIPTRVFALAESPVKATREVASALIRRHYRKLGGAARLAWLMESPDREVRLFAVRLLWEQHRPLAIPTNWQPKKGPGTGRVPEAGEHFESGEELRQFLRTVLFGLPPGRMERREAIEGLPTRQMSASEGKRRLIEVVRDLSIEQREFAAIGVPVLDEFMHSRARGEWHGCVAALARIRHAHPDLTTLLPPALEPTQRTA
ncbi:hypothetical protein ACNOYE_33765 [Nannocystaceae bacterium ST9]